MLSRMIVVLGLLSSCLAGLIPSPDRLLNSVDHLLHPSPSVLSVDPAYVDGSSGVKRKLCTLQSLGDGGDDTDDFLSAVKECGHGGIIRLPDPT